MNKRKLNFILENFKIDPPKFENGCFEFTCYFHDKCSICSFKKDCDYFYEDLIPELTKAESKELKPYFPEWFI